MKTMQLVPAMEQGGVERGVVEMNRVIVAAGWRRPSWPMAAIIWSLT